MLHYKSVRTVKEQTDLISLFFLIFLGLVLIFYKHSQIPANLAIDEVAFAKVALSLDGKSISPYSPLETGHAAPYFYLILASLKTFGINTFAIRLPAAIFGILNIIVFYLLTKKVFKKSLFSAILTFIFLTSHWYLNFARFSYEATFLLFLELISIFFFINFWQNKNYLNLYLSALFAGLAFNSYLPGRLFFILPTVFFLIYEKRKYLFKYLLIVIIVIAPLIFYFLERPDVRIEQVSLISNQKLSVLEKTKQIGENIKKSALMFHLDGDMNGRHNFPGKPAINSILGLLLLFGLGRAFKEKDNIYNQLFLGLLLISILPSIFTYAKDNPNMLRTFTAIPSVIYFIGLGIESIFAIKKLKKEILASIIILIVMTSSFYELRTYFLFQSRVFRNSFEIICSLADAIKYEVDKIPLRCRVSKNLF